MPPPRNRSLGLTRIVMGVMVGFVVGSALYQAKNVSRTEPALLNALSADDPGCYACRNQALQPGGKCYVRDVCYVGMTTQPQSCTDCIKGECLNQCPGIAGCSPAGGQCNTFGDCCATSDLTCKDMPDGTKKCDTPTYCCAINSGCSIAANSGGGACPAGSTPFTGLNACTAGCVYYELLSCGPNPANCVMRNGPRPPGEMYFATNADCNNACHQYYEVPSCPSPGTSPLCNTNYTTGSIPQPPNGFTDLGACTDQAHVACPVHDLEMTILNKLYFTGTIFVKDGNTTEVEVSIKNNGPDTVQNFKFTLKAPDPRLGWFSNSYCTLSLDSLTLTCTISESLAAGASTSRRLTLFAIQRSSCTKGCVDDSAGLIIAEIISPGDTNTANNKDSAPVVIRCRLCCGDEAFPNSLGKFPGSNDDNDWEECDDGLSGSSTCTNQCTLIVCGDDKVQGTEICDSKTDPLCCVNSSQQTCRSLINCTCKKDSTYDAAAKICKCNLDSINGVEINTSSYVPEPACILCTGGRKPDAAQKNCVCTLPLVWDQDVGNCVQPNNQCCTDSNPNLGYCKPKP